MGRMGGGGGGGGGGGLNMAVWNVYHTQTREV